MNRPVFRCALLVAVSVFLSSSALADDPQSVNVHTPRNASVVPTSLDRLDAESRVIDGDRSGISVTPIGEMLETRSRNFSDLMESAPQGGPRGGAVTGACCFGESVCAIISQAACLDEGLNWIGADTTCDECPQLPNCPNDSLFAQSPGNPFDFEGAGVSEASAGLQRFEKFSGIVGPIMAVNFYGFDLGLTPGGSFVECVEADNTFQVSFHPDIGNRPGEATCTYVLTATRTPTGVYFIEGFELNAYEVALPTPCEMTRGWISIVGLGDANCNFVWSSPPGPLADDFSLCVGCTDVEQGLDLAVCLRGTFGNVFGACCDASDGTCTDNVEIFMCLGPTQQFTPNATCAELSPACGVITGACCGGEITRGVLCVDGAIEADCQKPNDRFEPNSVCQFLQPACGESVGACCIGTLSCLITTEEICSSEGWTWLGPDSTCAECPEQTPCPAGTIFAQPPMDISLEPSLYTSEASRGAIVFDDFSGVAGTITNIQFYGVDLQPIGQNSFIECEEPIPDFEIKFYEDQGNAPGPLVSAQVAPAVRTPTGIVYRGAEYNLYELALIEPVVLTRGWISIVGLGSPTCYFLWAPSADPAGGSVRDLPEYDRPRRQGNGFAFCLIGTLGNVTGACCNQATGVCSNGAAIENCVGPNDRFAPDGTCAIALADCGVPKGACCMGALECQFVTTEDCAFLGGEFLGVNSACLECACKVFCAPDAVAENEPVCSPAFQDVTNAGCDGASPLFTTLQPLERHCGTTGISFDGESFIADTDWYQIVATDFLDLAWRFESESPATIRFLDGTNGCPGILLDGGTVSACSQSDFFLFVPPGTYWIQIEPVGPSDASACGARYQLTPLNAPCDADFDFDRDVDMLDFAFFQPQYGMAGQGLFGDLNGDEVIDIADAHLFENELGTICP